MRTWRVGTLSMGIILVTFGSGLIYAQVNEKLVLDLAAQWWPLVFIFLGVEVLWQSYQAKKANVQVAYDILSVFIIILLLCFGLGMEALRETGVIEQCKTAMASRTFTLRDGSDPIPADAGLKTIIIEHSSEPLEIITCPTNQIKASYKIDITAPSREEAMQLIKQSSNMQTRREGDTLYIALNSSHPVSHMAAGIINQSNTLYLPEQMQVKIYSGVSELKIHASQILNNWYISGIDSAFLDFPAASNLQLTARTNSRSDLQGNATWEIKENLPVSSTNPGEMETSKLEGKLSMGTGQYKMMINSNGPVRVDLLP